MKDFSEDILYIARNLTGIYLSDMTHSEKRIVKKLQEIGILERKHDPNAVNDGEDTFEMKKDLDISKIS